MKRISLLIGLLVTSLVGADMAMASSPASTLRSSNADRQAIETLLASYTRCVTEHDEAGFEALLLDKQIPFSSVEVLKDSDAAKDLRHYEDFRKAVFASGMRLRQKFYNIHIEQRGALAQVSLDFVTEQVSGNGKSSTGWKLLQLVRIGDHWKIASELYTF
jgi:hypothetical protein